MNADLKSLLNQLLSDFHGESSQIHIYSNHTRSNCAVISIQTDDTGDHYTTTMRAEKKLERLGCEIVSHTVRNGTHESRFMVCVPNRLLQTLPAKDKSQTQRRRKSDVAKTVSRQHS